MPEKIKDAKMRLAKKYNGGHTVVRKRKAETAI